MIRTIHKVIWYSQEWLASSNTQKWRQHWIEINSFSHCSQDNFNIKRVTVDSITNDAPLPGACCCGSPPACLSASLHSLLKQWHQWSEAGTWVTARWWWGSSVGRLLKLRHRQCRLSRLTDIVTIHKFHNRRCFFHLVIASEQRIRLHC
jgi:hypothetical protein